MKSNRYSFLVALFALLSSAGHAIAHHSFGAEFDAQKPVSLKGIVVKWEMINPHGWITIDVPGVDGKTTRWMVETSNPNGLMRLGWTKRSLKAETGSLSRRIGPRTGRTRQTPHRSRLRTAAECLRVLPALRRERQALRLRKSEPAVKIVHACYCCVILAAILWVLPKARLSGPLSAQSTTTLPRLPGGRPDLQGLWMKSASGFQGLFIGSLDGTNFAAPGRGRGDGGRGGRGGGYEYTPEAEAERTYRVQHGYEDPEARCHLPGVPRALDQPAGLYPVQIIQDEKSVALLHEAMHDVRIIPVNTRTA